ncbi:hypothetical protein PIB30_048685 [Stylosanthes scabra]|uniref:Uncharacterized protein n=1 Tax=Stylosanthes scabra TaxID=79078 RepID=A0ABU6RH43_9FABA|nr:hypothetical protein [Stylosanthes scabra]
MENHVAIELEAMVMKAQPLFTAQSCCIYKVPHEVRQLNEDAYTPVLVSIGPLHHGNPRLVTMEAHKQFCCQQLIQKSEASLSDLVSCVQELEPQIRACYSEKIELTVDEFVKVIFIDYCFVIEFVFNYETMLSFQSDSIFSKPWVVKRVMYDLILLENQVPFFVLEKLYNLALLARNRHFPSFTNFVVSKFSFQNEQSVLPPPDTNSIAHFTDLLRYLYLPPFHTRPSRYRRGQLGFGHGGLLVVLGHGASEFVEAGVKFTVNESRQGCIIDLKYEYGILKIPHILLLEDWTEISLRNILALEHCHYPQEHYVFDYVDFISQLINTGKDVDTLVENGIFNNQLGDNKNVAEFFRGLKRNIVVTSYNATYFHISQELDAYYRNPLHKNLAAMKRWKGAVSIGGIVLLILTIIQTVFTILQVVL